LWAIVAALVFGLGVILNALGIGEQPTTSTDTTSTDSFGSDGSHSIVYRVEGDSNRADITFQNAGGDTSQQADRSVPWSWTFRAEEGAFLYVSAQRGGAPGDIACSIEVDGIVVKTSSSSGPFTICTASGVL
jgi:hypothetical protein